MSHFIPKLWQVWTEAERLSSSSTLGVDSCSGKLLAIYSLRAFDLLQWWEPFEALSRGSLLANRQRYHLQTYRACNWILHEKFETLTTLLRPRFPDLRSRFGLHLLCLRNIVHCMLDVLSTNQRNIREVTWPILACTIPTFPTFRICLLNSANDPKIGQVVNKNNKTISIQVNLC